MVDLDGNGRWDIAAATDAVHAHLRRVDGSRVRAAVREVSPDVWDDAQQTPGITQETWIEPADPEAPIIREMRSVSTSCSSSTPRPVSAEVQTTV